MGWYWLMNGMWLRVAKLWRDYIIKIINRHLCYDKYKMYNIKVLILSTFLFIFIAYNNINTHVGGNAKNQLCCFVIGKSLISIFGFQNLNLLFFALPPT